MCGFMPLALPFAGWAQMFLPDLRRMGSGPRNPLHRASLGCLEHLRQTTVLVDSLRGPYGVRSTKLKKVHALTGHRPSLYSGDVPSMSIVGGFT